MKPEYQDWIAAYKLGVGSRSLMGMCGAATAAMKLEFPELRLARGIIQDGLWGERTHWWCVAPDGTIVDPTVSQFPAFFGEYQELRDGDRIPSGRCMDCGKTVYDGATFCNRECEMATADYLMRP